MDTSRRGARIAAPTRTVALRHLAPEADPRSADLPVRLRAAREALLPGSALGFVVTLASAAPTLVVAVATAPQRPRGGDA